MSTNEYSCVRCGYVASTRSKMETHIDRKTKCKLSQTGLNINLADYKEHLLDRTFDKMKKCPVCDVYFTASKLSGHNCSSDKKSSATKNTTKNDSYCERCHKNINFVDPDHTVVCNDTLEEYKNAEDEREMLLDEVRELRMLNMKLNEELFKFVGIVNKCIDDYLKSKNQELPINE